MSKNESGNRFKRLTEGLKDRKTLSFLLLMSLLANALYFFIVIGHDIPENAPKAEIFIDAESYTCSYDVRSKNPNWVMEVLRKEDSLNTDGLTKAEYITDLDLPGNFLSTLEDYKNSNFDASSLLVSPRYVDTRPIYPLATCCPQPPEFKKGYWAKFNDYVRERSKVLGVKKVLVITQPLYLPNGESKTGEQVVYNVVGKNNVAVPTHYFRAIFYPSPGQDKCSSMMAPTPVPTPIPGNLKVKGEIYVIPNTEIEENTPLENFRIRGWEEIDKFPRVIFPKDIASYLDG